MLGMSRWRSLLERPRHKLPCAKCAPHAKYPPKDTVKPSRGSRSATPTLKAARWNPTPMHLQDRHRSLLASSLQEAAPHLLPILTAISKASLAFMFSFHSSKYPWPVAFSMPLASPANALSPKTENVRPASVKSCCLRCQLTARALGLEVKMTRHCETCTFYCRDAGQGTSQPAGRPRIPSGCTLQVHEGHSAHKI